MQDTLVRFQEDAGKQVGVGLPFAIQTVFAPRSAERRQIPSKPERCLSVKGFSCLLNLPR